MYDVNKPEETGLICLLFDHDADIEPGRNPQTAKNAVPRNFSMVSRCRTLFRSNTSGVFRKKTLRIKDLGTPFGEISLILKLHVGRSALVDRSVTECVKLSPEVPK